MADIILIAVLVIFAAMGAKKGLISTLVGVASTVLSLLLSLMLYNPVSKALFESQFGVNVKEFVHEMLLKNAEGAAKLLVTDATVEAASMLVMNVISFVAVILISKIAIMIVSHVLNFAAKLPVIKQANKLLGMVAGVLSGLLVCYIALGVIKALSPDGTALLLKDSIENSILAFQMYSDNIVFDALSSFMKK